MKKFELNQKVIVKSNPESRLCQPRTRGEICEITGIMYCPKNGHQLININHTPAIIKTGITSCTCGDDHPDHNLAWTLAEHFVGADEVESFMYEAVEEEEYELAAKLRDLKL